jgi:hypothetical protein
MDSAFLCSPDLPNTMKNLTLTWLESACMNIDINSQMTQATKHTLNLLPRKIVDELSWEFGDSSHGDGLMEGFDDGDDGSSSGLCQRRHLGYPGSGPSTPEVKPLLPACFLLALPWLQCSSSCSSRGGRRRRIPSPRLRVQTPLYRRGSDYRLGGRLPGCRLLAAASSA